MAPAATGDLQIGSVIVNAFEAANFMAGISIIASTAIVAGLLVWGCIKGLRFIQEATK